MRRKYPGIISHAIVSASVSELAGAVATRAVEGKRETGRVRNEKSDRTPKNFQKINNSMQSTLLSYIPIFPTCLTNSDMNNA